MRLADAMSMMQGREEPRGFRVNYEEIEGCILRGGFFPERDEEPFKTEAEAWTMAQRFAEAAPQRFVDIYVIGAHDFVPVDGYDAKMLRRRA